MENYLPTLPSFASVTGLKVDPVLAGQGILVVNGLIIVILLGIILAYRETFGDNTYILCAACISLMFCVYPPSISAYYVLLKKYYTFENYILQVFIPMLLGFVGLIAIVAFDLLKDFEVYYEALIIYVGCGSILSSAIAYTFMMYRIKYLGT
jgi:hypothetical protein